jgi:GxxExxY protein
MVTEMQKREEVARAVVQSFYYVYNALGYGFLEKVYENALQVRLEQQGLLAEKQRLINVFFEGQVVGEYFADLLVEQCLIVEVKCVDALADEHTAQLLNYLKATGISLGLLLNFGPKPQVKRRIYSSKPPPQP